MESFEIDQVSKQLESSQIEIYNLEKSNNVQTLIKLLKIAFGSGIFALPYAFQQSGIFAGIILQIIILVFTYKSWCTLVECIGEAQHFTLFQHITNKYGSNSWLLVLSIVVTIIFNFGSGVSYMILFNEVVLQTLQNQSLQMKIILALSIFAIQFISQFITNIKQFMPILTCSIFLILLTVLFLYGLSFNNIQNWQMSHFQLNTAMIAFGIDLFSYDINGVITEIKAEMSVPTNFKPILLLSMIIEGIVYISFGAVGSLSYSTNTKDSILTNYQIENVGSQIYIILEILLISYVSTLIVSNLVMCIPVYQIFNNLTKNPITQIILRTSYFSAQLLISFVFPNFALILSIFGCVCSVTLGYIIPYILSLSQNYHFQRKLLNLVVVSFGIIGGIMGLYATFI